MQRPRTQTIVISGASALILLAAGTPAVSILGTTPHHGPEETTMHPIISRELATARIADVHRHAARHQIARSAIKASRSRRDRGTNPVAGRPAADRARRVLTLPGARSA